MDDDENLSEISMNSDYQSNLLIKKYKPLDNVDITLDELKAFIDLHPELI